MRRYVENPAGKILTGGLGDGWSIRPPVVVDAPADSPIQCEEIVGPVVTVTPFESEAEAVHAANDSPYGLNAMIFTENLSRAHRVGARLRVGTICATCGPRSADSATPAGAGRAGTSAASSSPSPRPW